MFLPPNYEPYLYNHAWKFIFQIFSGDQNVSEKAGIKFTLIVFDVLQSNEDVMQFLIFRVKF